MNTGQYKCVWVRVGEYGCVGVQGAREGMNAGHEETKMVKMGGFSYLWPGKFPGTSCFLSFDKKTNIYACGCIIMGSRGWGGNAWSRREVKTSQNEFEMGERGVFCNVCTQ